MNPLLAQLAPLATLLIPIGIVYGLIEWWEWQAKHSNKKNPLTSDLLRGPGEALREKLFELRTDIFANVFLVFFMPPLAVSMFLALNKHSTPSVLVTWIYIGSTTIIIVRALIQLLRAKKTYRKYTLGLDAEIAVGQELNHLMRTGFWVYHDFPADGFNIDHVLIGPSGVFAIETKGRSKPVRDDGIAECEVIYDGESLRFPTWIESKPLTQAQAQARWLEKWLSSAVGEPVAVIPVLAIPGWFIKRIKPNGILVINGKNSSSLFSKLGNEQLSEKLQRQIVHQIESRCRNVLPRAYNSLK